MHCKKRTKTTNWTATHIDTTSNQQHTTRLPQLADALGFIATCVIALNASQLVPAMLNSH